MICSKTERLTGVVTILGLGTIGSTTRRTTKFEGAWHSVLHDIGKTAILQKGSLG